MNAIVNELIAQLEVANINHQSAWDLSNWDLEAEYKNQILNIHNRLNELNVSFDQIRQIEIAARRSMIATQ